MILRISPDILTNSAFQKAWLAGRLILRRRRPPILPMAQPNFSCMATARPETSAITTTTAPIGRRSKPGRTIIPPPIRFPPVTFFIWPVPGTLQQARHCMSTTTRILTTVLGRRRQLRALLNSGGTSRQGCFCTPMASTMPPTTLTVRATDTT